MRDLLIQFFYALGIFLLFLAAEFALVQYIDLTLNQRGPNGESQYRFMMNTLLPYGALMAGTILCLFCFVIPRHMLRIKKERELAKSKSGRYDTYGSPTSYEWNGGGNSYASSGFDDFSAGLNKAKSDKDTLDDDELSDKDKAKLKKIMKAMRAEK
jgi:hypothetical protein